MLGRMLKLSLVSQQIESRQDVLPFRIIRILRLRENFHTLGDIKELIRIPLSIVGRIGVFSGRSIHRDTPPR